MFLYSFILTNYELIIDYNNNRDKILKSPFTKERCSSWNCCDENLQLCIDRSEYVKRIRNKIKNKKFKKSIKINKI